MDNHIKHAETLAEIRETSIQRSQTNSLNFSSLWSISICWLNENLCHGSMACFSCCHLSRLGLLKDTSPTFVDSGQHFADSLIVGQHNGAGLLPRGDGRPLMHLGDDPLGARRGLPRGGPP